ncbi:hypothetical protein JY651_21490 [Pyxidicoccus parkwayensis]|uniref:Lipoprotein n=1 Tax=Pyxidicoccus parkwayensis TaxID=2813578 RepID=A0ABX7PA56_9BACT|nr:hypothetical protein [Pyxidicoccus parkwaysis]QSQ27321.1 hypothetical protein JY651_21490 [Pyxidicoccus parkwaysis]
MRTLMLLTLSVGLLAGCGDSTNRDNGNVPEGGVCTSNSQCAIDFTCVGCAGEDSHCLAGCTTNADCSAGECKHQQCITCPCPGICQT